MSEQRWPTLDYYTLADLFGGTGCEAEGSPASLAGDAQLTYPNIEKWTCWDSSTDILGQVRAGPVTA